LASSSDAPEVSVDYEGDSIRGSTSPPFIKAMSAS
jgi:hypothetical protein